VKFGIRDFHVMLIRICRFLSIVTAKAALYLWRKCNYILDVYRGTA